MSKIHLPSDAAAFERLREQARRTAGLGPGPRPASSIVPGSKPSPGAPGPKLEGPGPKTPEDPRPKSAAPASSRDGDRREPPVRATEKVKVGEAQELEPEEPDLMDLFHGRPG